MATGSSSEGELSQRPAVGATRRPFCFATGLPSGRPFSEGIRCKFPASWPSSWQGSLSLAARWLGRRDVAIGLGMLAGTRCLEAG